MSNLEHRIPGKDAPLETSIERLQSLLAARGFDLEEQSWLNPVADCWSVHLRDRDCPLLFTNGKGSSQLAARASALGEFIERVSCNHFWTHYYLGETLAKHSFVLSPEEKWFPLNKSRAWPKALLTPELQTFYNPEGTVATASLVEQNSGNAMRGICALPHVRQRDGKTVWFPANIIGNLYLSNGLSAGNTPSEARTQALSEVLERFVKFRVLREGLCLPEVPAEVIARYPRIEAGIKGLRDAGFGIHVKDASLGGQFPVMVVTLLHPQDHGVYTSFGAHPRFEVALERALTELLQGRALDALAGFPPPGFDLEEVADPQNLEIHFVDSSGIISWNFLGDAADFAFNDWNFSGTTTEEFSWLVDCIHTTEHDIYIADFEHLGAYACRIIVPGMSEVYPIEDLEWENNSIGNRVRPALLKLPDLDDAECNELLDALEELELADERLVSILIGLAADADSPWATLRVGELKALLALKLGDREASAEGCAWVTQFGHVAESRSRVYRALEALLRLENATQYERALADLYGAEALTKARKLIAGQDPFFDLCQLGPDLQGSVLHQRLLVAYRKAWQMPTAIGKTA